MFDLNFFFFGGVRKNLRKGWGKKGRLYVKIAMYSFLVSMWKRGRECNCNVMVWYGMYR